MSAPINSADQLESTRVVSLPSGRDLVIRSGATEVVEVRSPDGRVELSVALTEQGPVLRVTGARLEMRADTLALEARQIEIRSDELTNITSAGEIVVQGSMIRLN